MLNWVFLLKLLIDYGLISAPWQVPFLHTTSTRPCLCLWLSNTLRRLLIHFSNDKTWQGHVGYWAHKFDRQAVVNETIAYAELFGLAAVLVKQVDDKRVSLIGACMKIATFNEQIASAYCLWAKMIEQSDFVTRHNAH